MHTKVGCVESEKLNLQSQTFFRELLLCNQNFTF